jgi:NAD(P)-dependent dehydrogenase (short-subunit alcohol dehydrogenase family)
VGVSERHRKSAPEPLEPSLKTVDVVIVGVGVMGAAAGRALAQRGRNVLMLEQFHVGHERGSSHGTARYRQLAATMYLAEEIGQYGITVNAIAPGYIQTAMALAELGEAEGYDDAGGVALRRWGTTEDCARVIEFLCTDLSDYVTGQVIVIDGGLSLLDPLG